MSDLDAIKAAARAAAFARRKAAFAAAGGRSAAEPLMAVLGAHRGRPLAGYMAMRSEIDPAPAMTQAARHGAVGVPVIMGKDMPLQFRQWTPQAQMIDGPFGAKVPEAGGWVVPEVLIVPLVAFDRRGGRLGYGGGFYDRTLEGLRAAGPVLAIGFTWAAQEDDALPLEPVDQPLDLIVTEAGVITPER